MTARSYRPFRKRRVRHLVQLVRGKNSRGADGDGGGAGGGAAAPIDLKVKETTNGHRMLRLARRRGLNQPLNLRVTAIRNRATAGGVAEGVDAVTRKSSGALGLNARRRNPSWRKKFRIHPWAAGRDRRLRTRTFPTGPCQRGPI